MTEKCAVVLFNLGGPDGPDAVRPFLFNLFNDPAIIGAPTPIRWLVAKLISARRAPVAREIYDNLGGGSPLLTNTQAQADALEIALGGETHCFVAMRYWHPLAAETAARVKAFAPDRIVLLPLYPQFSTTTTASSLRDWRSAAKKAGLDVPTQAICCYFGDAGFIEAIAARVRAAIDAVSDRQPRVLFTAHGLPQRVVAAGDPYEWQIEQTAEAIVSAVDRPNLDWIVCYQSRVGPLEWLKPYTSEVLEAAGRDGKPVIVVPIGFTSEHSETLVELDIEYRALAEKAGVSRYDRIDTVGANVTFIEGLADLVRRTIADGAPLSSHGGTCRCPDAFADCPFR